MKCGGDRITQCKREICCGVDVVGAVLVVSVVLVAVVGDGGG